jgi:two-component system chemotaxis response regulator CheB
VRFKFGINNQCYAPINKNGQPIRILMADVSAFIRNRLSMMLMKCSSLQVLGTAMNGLDAIEQAKRTQPDVMMLDIERPSMNGFGSIRLIEYGIV